MAKLIKKEAKGETTITNAVSSLVSADAGNKATIVKVKADAEKTKIVNEAEAEKIKLTAKADATKLKAEAEIIQAKANVDLAKADGEIVKAKAETSKIKNEAIKQVIEMNKTKLSKTCNNLANNVALDNSFAVNLSNLKVCIDSKNKITAGACDENLYNAQTLLCVDDIGIDTQAIAEGKSIGMKWDTKNPITAPTGSLPAGIYKVELGGAKGGSASTTHTDGGTVAGQVVGAVLTGGISCLFGGCKSSSSSRTTTYSGGNGEVIERIIFLDSAKMYTATLGSPTTFVINGVTSLSARGGGAASAGSDGVAAGNGKNSGNAYIKIYRKQ